MKSFTAEIFIIGINPYIFVPEKILAELFIQAGRSKGTIPVKGKLNGKLFHQTLVKYSGEWRLYLNTPMRKAAGIDVGDIADVKIEVDNVPRITPIHPKLDAAFRRNKKAKEKFNALSPSRQKEIKRYLNSLKTDESLKRNVERVIQHLEGKKPFAGRQVT